MLQPPAEFSAVRSVLRTSLPLRKPRYARLPKQNAEPSLCLSRLRAQSLRPFGTWLLAGLRRLRRIKKTPPLPARPPASHRKLRAFALSPSQGAGPLHSADASLQGPGFCFGASSSSLRSDLRGLLRFSTQSNPSPGLKTHVPPTFLLHSSGRRSPPLPGAKPSVLPRVLIRSRKNTLSFQDDVKICSISDMPAPRTNLPRYFTRNFLVHTSPSSVRPRRKYNPEGNENNKRSPSRTKGISLPKIS